MQIQKTGREVKQAALHCLAILNDSPHDRTAQIIRVKNLLRCLEIVNPNAKVTLDTDDILVLAQEDAWPK